MIHIITKNTYFRQGLMHLLEENEYCIDTTESSLSSLKSELSPSDIVLYHVDKSEYLWVSEVLDVSYRAKVILFKSSSHLRMCAINNVIAVIDENASLELILSVVKKSYSCKVIPRQRGFDLTTREHYILVETVRTTSPHVIARLLNISVKTVYAQRSNAYRKLGVKTIHDIFQLQGCLL